MESSDQIFVITYTDWDGGWVVRAPSSTEAITNWACQMETDLQQVVDRNNIQVIPIHFNKAGIRRVSF